MVKNKNKKLFAEAHKTWQKFRVESWLKRKMKNWFMKIYYAVLIYEKMNCDC